MVGKCNIVYKLPPAPVQNACAEGLLKVFFAGGTNTSQSLSSMGTPL
jgi:hypothetical protein